MSKRDHKSEAAWRGNGNGAQKRYAYDRGAMGGFGSGASNTRKEPVQKLDQSYQQHQQAHQRASSQHLTVVPTPRSTLEEFTRPPSMWHRRSHTDMSSRIQDIKVKPGTFKENDFTANYMVTDELPVNFVRNVKNPVEGYPKLQRLFHLKERQTDKFASIPYGARVELKNMVPTLNRWIVRDRLVFDVIMIGGLTENQFIYQFLVQIPLERLCSKPGFLFIWASSQQINELTKLLNSDGWTKKFRRSEELVFVPVNKKSRYYPTGISKDETAAFESLQWHCWMCITGTVRRSSDGHLIHCNVDTDLKIENEEENQNQVVPTHIYKVAENFSSATRRLHIIPARSGYNNPVIPRRGWVIMSPDIIIDNFDPARYKAEIMKIGSNVPQDQDIENIRPKSPVPRNAQLHTGGQKQQQQQQHPNNQIATY